MWVLFKVLFKLLHETDIENSFKQTSVWNIFLVFVWTFFWMPLSPVSLSLQSKELVKAYPPFVNFFEMSKDTIVRCEKQKPRFHAFLKVWPLLLFCRRLFAWLEDVHADETFKEFAKRKIMKTGRIMTLLHSNTTNIAVSISPWSLYIIPVTQSTPLHKTRVLVTCLELLLLLQSSSIVSLRVLEQQGYSLCYQASFGHAADGLHAAQTYVFPHFVQINQSKPECGRQTLVELLIRPVQRLPSVALLLNGNSRTHPFIKTAKNEIMSCANYIPPCLFSLSVSFNTCLPPSLSPVDTVCNFFSSLFFSSHLCPHDFHLFLPFCLSTNFPFFFFFQRCRHKEAYVRWQPRQDNTGESNWVSERSDDVSWHDLSPSFVMITQPQHCLIVSSTSCEVFYHLYKFDHYVGWTLNNWSLLGQDFFFVLEIFKPWHMSEQNMYLKTTYLRSFRDHIQFFHQSLFKSLNFQSNQSHESWMYGMTYNCRG